MSFGNDLAVRNGEDSWTLPMPGRFVIDRSGIIRTVDVDPDYRFRPEPEKTVEDGARIGVDPEQLVGRKRHDHWELGHSCGSRPRARRTAVRAWIAGKRRGGCCVESGG